MKKSISSQAATVIIVIAVLLVGFFGYRMLFAPPHGDVTQSMQNFYKNGGIAKAMQKQPPVQQPASGQPAGN